MTRFDRLLVWRPHRWYRWMIPVAVLLSMLELTVRGIPPNQWPGQWRIVIVYLLLYHLIFGWTIPSIALWRRRSTRRGGFPVIVDRVKPARLCPVCGYDLRATPDRCPECGAEAVAKR